MNNSKITILTGGQVLLDLPNCNFKSRNRKIGFILDRIFYTERNKKKHLFRADNSIGFNYKLINQCTLFDLVCCNLDFKDLWTSKLVIKTIGTCREFSKKDFELQIFLQLKCFKDTKEEAIAEVEQLDKNFNPAEEQKKMNAALNNFSMTLNIYKDIIQEKLF